VGSEKDFSWMVVALDKEPFLLKMNGQYQCNEGAERDWERLSVQK
jgi:hypothetical protein